MYEGEFKCGLFDGLGQLTFSNGEKFNGRFCCGKIDGDGTFYLKSGDVVIGTWEKNKLVCEF